MNIADYLSTLFLISFWDAYGLSDKKWLYKKMLLRHHRDLDFCRSRISIMEYQHRKKQKEELALQSARSVFNLIAAARSWNASHGGVYAPANASTQPNPYLDPHLRDIKVNDTLTLTKINPAYMTRLISEVAARDHGFQFHITSLKPIRPGNKANEWEKKHLRPLRPVKLNMDLL